MKRLAMYLVVTFALSWGVWIPLGIAQGTFVNGENSSPIMIAAITVGMFFPLIGALVSNAMCKPEERMSLCFKPRVKGHVGSYIAAWLLPTPIALLGCIVFFCVFPQLFDPQASALVAAAQTSGLSADQAPIMVAVTIASAVLLAPFINMIPALGEEAGWRGMLFPTLAEHMSERAAALVSGAIWGLWHAPIIAMGHNYGMNYLGFPTTGILTMTLLCIALACWLSYLRVKSESVWPCALCHGAINAVASVGLLFCATGASLWGPSMLGLVSGIPLMVVGVVCWLRLSGAKRERA
jgi:membrane protease YdiL (CAAX protease family)